MVGEIIIANTQEGRKKHLKRNTILLIVMTIINFSLLLMGYYNLTTFVMFMVPIYFLRNVQLQLTQRNKWLLSIFVVLYVLLNVFSFTLNPPQLFNRYLLISLLKFVAYGGYLWLLISMKQSDWFYQDSDHYNKKSNRKYAIILFIALAFLFTPFTLAFSPGNMFVDSYSQWGQALGGISLSDWHPFFTTMLLRVSYLISGTPIVYMLSQVLATIAVFTYFAYLLSSYGIKKWISATLTFSLIFMTVVIPNMVTIYKDNFYNIALFLLTMIIFQIIQTEGKWLKGHLGSWLLLTITFTFVMLSRHNGLYVGIAALLAFIIFGKNIRKQMTGLLVTMLAIYMVYAGPVMNHYEVEAGSPSEKYSILVQHIGAILAEDKEIASEEEEFLAEILPIETWQEKYAPAMVDPVKFHADYDKTVIDNNQGQFLETWWHLVTAYPMTALEAHMQQVRPLWDINGWEHGLPGSVMFHYFNDPPKEFYADYEVNYSLGLQSWRDKFEEISFSENPQDLKTKPFITSLSAISVFAILIVAIYLLVKKRWQMVLVLLPALFHIGTLLLAMPAYNMRYVLGIIFVGAFALVLPILSSKSEQ